MKHLGTKHFGLAAICLLVLRFGAGAQESQTGATCTDISGAISGAFTGDTTVLGTVTGDLSGAVTATILEQSRVTGGMMGLQLEHIFLTAAGDMLRTTDKATLTPVSEGVARMTTRYTIVGGSGAFEGATGRLENHGEVDFNRGLLTLRYHGNVCTG